MTPSEDAKSRRIILDASYIAIAHTVLATFAFLSALILGCLLHYKKIVKNDVAQWPDEWWPSVSATIGDWYPERNIFQILIALTSGPRFALVVLQYYVIQSPNSFLPTFVLLSGLVRTLSCGGWVYITSSDDHDAHDILMVTYIVCNLPWMLGGIAQTPRKSIKARHHRRYIATACANIRPINRKCPKCHDSFFLSIVPLVYFFIQHKAKRIPGAYTRYSIFEWSLIIFDILYDSVAFIDFRDANLQIAIGSDLSNLEQQLAKSSHNANAALGKLIASAEGVAQVDSTNEEAVVVLNSWQNVKALLPEHSRSALSFGADVYLSYIFWSIFTSLVPTLFYFSVWELTIAGAELALLSTLSPILLAIPKFLPWVRSREGRMIMHALSFLGLAAYALPKPLQRLLVVTFATAVLIIRQVVDWTGADENGVGYQSILMSLGLITSSLSKHANHSNNPVWPMVNEKSGGYNKTGIALACLALCELYLRPSHVHHEANKERPSTRHDLASKPTNERQWVSSSIAFGSLIFSLHTFLVDSSTLIAWSWTGWQNRQPQGPQPNLHGCLTIAAQSLGMLLAIMCSSRNSRFLMHPLWFGYGAASAFVLYRCSNWLGYVGGLNLAVFLMSALPHILGNVALHSRGRVAMTYFVALLFAMLYDLGGVWTVAYAFVPGGIYLRERTDLVLVAQMAGLALSFDWPGIKARGIRLQLPGRVASFTCRSLVVLCAISTGVTFYRMPSSPPKPFHAGERIMSAGIWTLHFGMDNEGRDSQRLVRNLIRDMELDVVGLLETDLHRIAFGNRDLTRVITEESGYYVDLGPGPNKHTWGAVLLSKFPIINTTHHLLPSPRGELAPAIEAWLDVYGTEVLVVVAHNGQEEDPLDRELQSRELARIMSSAYPHPTVFLGYVVTKPKAPQPAPYDILVTDGRMYDVDSDDWDRWCEYIFYRGLYRTVFARVSRGIVTDTELQLARFVLPKHGYGVTNETEEARMYRSWKEGVPEVHWYPLDYYGNDEKPGKGGHYYHVWFTVSKHDSRPLA